MFIEHASARETEPQCIIICAERHMQAERDTEQYATLVVLLPSIISALRTSRLKLLLFLLRASEYSQKTATEYYEVMIRINSE